MRKPAPALSAAAVRILPPPPDASVMLLSKQGEEMRYPEDEVYLDLLAFGRVLGPPEEDEDEEVEVVGPGPWEMAWRDAPLVLHDGGLMGVINAVAPDIAYVSGAVSSAAISRALQEHPGPVGCLRIDSSDCPSPDLVSEWMDLIQAKEGRGGIRELVVVNTRTTTTCGKKGEKDEDGGGDLGHFPLHRLPGGLKNLALGFLPMGDPLEGEHLTRLAELRLVGCAFCGQALSALLPSLLELSTLVLGCCCVTRGRGHGLIIVSLSLRRLELWSCTASGGVWLQYTPRLGCLNAGVRPEPEDLDGAPPLVRVDMRTPGALRELRGLTLQHHDLTFASQYTTKVQRRKIAALPILAILDVRLNMSIEDEVSELLKMLHHLPYLTDMTITRLDPADEEKDKKKKELQQQQQQEESMTTAEAPFPSFKRLKHLVLQDFRGGTAETALATRVLAVASDLASLVLRPHPELPLTAAVDASAPLLRCPRASASCIIGIASSLPS